MQLVVLHVYLIPCTTANCYSLGTLACVDAGVSGPLQGLLVPNQSKLARVLLCVHAILGWCLIVHVCACGFARTWVMCAYTCSCVRAPCVGVCKHACVCVCAWAHQYVCVCSPCVSVHLYSKHRVFGGVVGLLLHHPSSGIGKHHLIVAVPPPDVHLRGVPRGECLNSANQRFSTPAQSAHCSPASDSSHFADTPY